MNTADLMNIKAGDEVLVSGRYNNRYVVRVERLTPTQIVTRRTRFRRDTGQEVGTSGDWFSPIIVGGCNAKGITEVKANDKRKMLVNYLNNQENDLSLETIEAIWELIERSVK